MTTNSGGLHSTLFEHEMVGTGRTLSRDHKVEVVFEGNQAKTDGSVIVFPSIPTRELTQREVMIGRGYVDHETAHKRYTDFEAGAPIIRQAKADPLRAALLQCVEDGRIEARNIADYPGSAKNLRVLADATAEAALPTIKGLAKNPKTDWRMVAAAGLTWAARMAMGNGSAGEQVLLDTIPDTVRAFCKEAAVRALTARSTSESVALANELREHLGKIDGTKESFNKKPKSGNGKGEGEGEGGGEGDGEARRGDSGEAGGEDSGEAGGEDAGSAVDALKPTEAGESHEIGGSKDDTTESGGGKGASTGEMSDKVEENFKVLDPADLITKTLGSTPSQRTKSGKHTVYSKNSDVTHAVGGRDSLSRSMTEWVKTRANMADELIGKHAGRTAVIARKLELMLMDNMRDRWEGGLRSGRLDKRSLVRAGAFAAEDVFARKVEERRTEAAVSILMDMSGSMSNGEKMYVARDVMLILSQALDRTGVAFEVNGFSSRGEVREKVKPTSSSMGSWGRTCRLDTFRFKAWNDTYRQVRGAMAGFASLIGGDNPDPDAIIDATARLLSRPERKKVLLVLSDGSPAYAHTIARLSSSELKPGENSLMVHYSYRATKQAVEDAERVGVKTIGIGILDDSVQLFYPRHAVIERIEDLAGETLDQIATALLGDGRRLKVAA
jgi:cobaltochelatase CobT